MAARYGVGAPERECMSMAVTLKAYKAKYRKLPTLGDDMTDEGEEGEDVDEGNGDSDS